MTTKTTDMNNREYRRAKRKSRRNAMRIDLLGRSSAELKALIADPDAPRERKTLAYGVLQARR